MKAALNNLLLISLILLVNNGMTAQELRVGVDFDKYVLPDLEFNSKAQLRSFYYNNRVFYSIMQVGLGYRIVKNVTLAGSFRYSLSLNGVNDNFLENVDEKRRYCAEAIFRSDRLDNGIRFAGRIRYQHSATDQGKTRDYLRSKVQVDYQLVKEMTPYAGLESYFWLGENRFRKYRLYLGTDIEVIRKDIEVNYIVEVMVDDNRIAAAHMIGIFLEL